jgi:hypothetical protein
MTGKTCAPAKWSTGPGQEALLIDSEKEGISSGRKSEAVKIYEGYEM